MRQHLQTAWHHIRRAPYQALSAVAIMSLTFFVASILGILAYGSWVTLTYFETRPQVIAFLKDEATPSQISAVQRRLEADRRVTDVRYVSKEQALEIYKEATADNPLLFELVSPEIFPASLEFSLADLSFASEIITELKGEPFVEQVGFTASLGGQASLEDVVENLRRLTTYLRLGGTFVLSFLLGASLLILLMIVGIRVSTRRDEIEVLKLIGATPGFIRLPFILEALFYTVLGTLVGWLLASLLILYATPAISSWFGEIPVIPDTAQGLALLFGGLLGAELVLAILLGSLGSLVALSRYLRL